MELKFSYIKKATFDGKEYVHVGAETMKALEAAGFSTKECYKPQNTFDFVSQLLADEEAIEMLKARIPEGDNKPMLFLLGSNLGAVWTWKSEYKGEFFGSTVWHGALADFGNAWGVFVTNAYR